MNRRSFLVCTVGGPVPAGKRQLRCSAIFEGSVMVSVLSSQLGKWIAQDCEWPEPKA